MVCIAYLRLIKGASVLNVESHFQVCKYCSFGLESWYLNLEIRLNNLQVSPLLKATVYITAVFFRIIFLLTMVGILTEGRQ